MEKRPVIAGRTCVKGTVSTRSVGTNSFQQRTCCEIQSCGDHAAQYTDQEAVHAEYIHIAGDFIIYSKNIHVKQIDHGAGFTQEWINR